MWKYSNILVCGLMRDEKKCTIGEDEGKGQEMGGYNWLYEPSEWRDGGGQRLTYMVVTS